MLKTTAWLRSAFLSFFKLKAHKVWPGSPVLQTGDPSLLFTNAGMNQFKNVFTNQAPAPADKVVTVQKCIRAGGKHNDLENVGFTKRHHTYFEMLGNFSFGAYGKKEAISLAWEFLTSEAWLNIPKEKLWVTVYYEDQETRQLWKEVVGLPEERVLIIHDKDGEPFCSDNFWQMGPVGPCGPSTEIFYDHGEGEPIGLPGSENEDCERFVEIWNLVFMQFNKTETGHLDPLPWLGIDTGMGLERIAAVVQGVTSNYEIDSFTKLLSSIALVLKQDPDNLQTPKLKVIADHMRAACCLVFEGLLPGNEGAGYVLRRLIRRAVLFGYESDNAQSFLAQVIPEAIESLAETNIGIRLNRPLIKEIIEGEERQFLNTIGRAYPILESKLKLIKNGCLPGAAAFQLYDTYGLPLEITEMVCSRKGIKVEMPSFFEALNRQKAQAKANSKFQTTSITQASELSSNLPATQFSGYEVLSTTSMILACVNKKLEPLASLSADQEGILILDQTPFYAESGGQLGDTGSIKTSDGSFAVLDTLKEGNLFLHKGKMISGTISSSTQAQAVVNADRRRHLMVHHTSAHLLQAALRTVLGAGVVQKGSLVTDQKLRFDFTYPKALSQAELCEVEELVNGWIREDFAVSVDETDLETAVNQGALSLPGEAYNYSSVRVVSVEPVSKELCGGTHVKRTGQIGAFFITFEGSIASGKRRIEAKAGQSAIEYFKAQQAILNHLCRQESCAQADLIERVKAHKEKLAGLALEVKTLKQTHMHLQAEKMLSLIQNSGGYKFVISALNKEEDPTILSKVLFANGIDLAVFYKKFNQNGSELVVLISRANSVLSAATIIKTLLSTYPQAKGGGNLKLARGYLPDVSTTALEHTLSTTLHTALFS